MELDEIRLFADSVEGMNLWDGELTRNEYFYPISINPIRLRINGKKLSRGLPSNEVYHRGPFVCALSPQSHLGPWKHAIDFLVPDGTPVVAPRDGIIVELQEHSNTWGTTAEFRDTLNYLTIGHENNEYTQYCHLAQYSVKALGLAIKSKVKRGQQIATVGKSGWTDRDHLHFLAFRNIDPAGLPFGTPNFKSLNMRFKPYLSQKLAAR